MFDWTFQEIVVGTQMFAIQMLVAYDEDTTLFVNVILVTVGTGAGVDVSNPGYRGDGSRCRRK